MRQAGYLAAAGIYALDNSINRLVHDHAKATALAGVLEKLPTIKHVLPVETNLVIAELAEDQTAAAYCEKLKNIGVLASPIAHNRVRFVLHLDIDNAMQTLLLEKITSLK